MIESPQSKLHEYRDTLELWMQWWNGPGRENYNSPVIPPLMRTEVALTCTLCAGVEEMDGGRCAACGREVGMPPGSESLRLIIEMKR
jgi:hypothetical protein